MTAGLLFKKKDLFSEKRMIYYKTNNNFCVNCKKKIDDGSIVINHEKKILYLFCKECFQKNKHKKYCAFREQISYYPNTLIFSDEDIIIKNNLEPIAISRLTFQYSNDKTIFDIDKIKSIETEDKTIVAGRTTSLQGSKIGLIEEDVNKKNMLLEKN